MCREMIEKIYSVTELHFLDYRSALHEDGNYRLARQSLLIGSRSLCGAVNLLTRKRNCFSTSLKTRNPVKGSIPNDFSNAYSFVFPFS